MPNSPAAASSGAVRFRLTRRPAPSVVLLPHVPKASRTRRWRWSQGEACLRMDARDNRRVPELESARGFAKTAARTSPMTRPTGWRRGACVRQTDQVPRDRLWGPRAKRCGCDAIPALPEREQPRRTPKAWRFFEPWQAISTRTTTPRPGPRSTKTVSECPAGNSNAEWLLYGADRRPCWWSWSLPPSS